MMESKVLINVEHPRPWFIQDGMDGLRTVRDFNGVIIGHFFSTEYAQVFIEATKLGE